jgi:hypothetical protein
MLIPSIGRGPKWRVPINETVHNGSWGKGECFDWVLMETERWRVYDEFAGTVIKHHSASLTVVGEDMSDVTGLLDGLVEPLRSLTDGGGRYRGQYGDWKQSKPQKRRGWLREPGSRMCNRKINDYRTAYSSAPRHRGRDKH